MAENYTPSESDLRYAWWVSVDNPADSEGESDEAFDRMLAKVRAEAKAEALVMAAESPSLYLQFDSVDRHLIRVRLMEMARAAKYAAAIEGLEQQ